MVETVVLKVAMSCQGCSGAVQRALSKMEGVDSFNVDLKEQKVTVTGNVKPEDVFQTVSKTGKKTSYWEAETETNTEAAPSVTETKTDAAPAVTETKIEASAVPETKAKTAADTAEKSAVPATPGSPTTTA
ncbi:Heavy metal-associated isoprenylated plant protein 36 [Rhynchospora pubera]|uniref:Heavy metal-associated isoprenylated plant protein 36 n=1 Tax=Rhynchospora pubera TaxID=906938 RepID=A0AAV8HIQ4_9POAL|nr:Heavy metal-associated isoprenylated plant protein 36 [Rhynchospora pubera]